ncbi:MAG: serine hydrolase [Chitinophagaceae bacterium]|nr:serine hydrolase [Chitinophagaceae bacterium]MCW5917970.1 serine hydrolase [Ferruginibacter sp.]
MMTYKKNSFLFGLLAAVIIGVAVFFIFKKISAATAVEEKRETYLPSNSNYHIIRKEGFEYIRPILFANESGESANLLSVKSDLNSMISGMKTSGMVAGASVYLRLLENGNWINAGDDSNYIPGSLMKVPELITFMKMNEEEPGLLSQKITYYAPLKLPKRSIYISKSIEVGKTYTIKELLYYMIAYSDNYATALLNNRMDLKIFKKVFTDLGLTEPDLSKSDIPITSNQFSRFMRALFNGTYLSNKDSEFCLELLSHSDFKNGILGGIPDNIKVSHKFGEAGDAQFSYLTESAIVYLNNTPFLLTIFSKGKNNQALPSAVSQISKLVYENLRTRS